MFDYDLYLNNIGDNFDCTLSSNTLDALTFTDELAADDLCNVLNAHSSTFTFQVVEALE